MKKILALILAALMMMTMFVACSDEKKEETKPEETTQAEDVSEPEIPQEPESDEDMIKDVIAQYAEAAMSLDAKALKKCIAEDSDLYAEVESLTGTESLKEQVSEMAEEAAEGFDGDKKVVAAFEEGINDLFDVCLGTIEIDYDDISINGDEATVEANLKMIDPENAFTEMGDFEKYLDDEFKEMSDEELAANISDAIENVFDNLIDDVENSDMEKVETSAVITLEKIDGEWLITSDN